MSLSNIFQLGVKELWSLLRDPMMLALIAFSFTLSVYSGSTAQPETLTNAPIAIVDEDQSPLSTRIACAFLPPYFLPAEMVTHDEMDARMDAGLDTFALDIPPDFQRDLLAGRQPVIQLNVDATRMTQAFNGASYIQTIVNDEVTKFASRYRDTQNIPIDLVVRVRFNQELRKSWFGAVMQLINQITMLSIILTGAALIRERERGTIEHLLAMPVTPLEIMLSKVWSMGLVVLLASTMSLYVVVQWILQTPIHGSTSLFLVGTALHLFATTSLGIFLGTFARSMPQFGLLMMLVLLPLQMLSGGLTPRESMPEFIQYIMLAAPNTHFVMLAQGILFRGAEISIVWVQFAYLAAIGSILFGIALVRFRSTIATMA
ncbi:ABC transporter permease [Blastopirellula marina]|uniref:ABC transmembrane type-2 domain-containing protein n=1 Tax=Blastopirellula marina TaxID=124 RepID=A0A2S8GRH6_9BACT|nr:ABC transporter permease [Blastopirellula marina]PQO47025.1 hypothetical protein C5Y93_05895 [Blastopirellula marina]